MRDTGFFWIDYYASGTNQEGKEVVCRGKVGSDKGDPGYKETAKVGSLSTRPLTTSGAAESSSLPEARGLSCTVVQLS